MNTHTYVNASIYTQSMIYRAEGEVFARYEPSQRTTSCVGICLVTFVNVSAQPSPLAVAYAFSKCLIKLKWFKNNDDKYLWIPALHGSAAHYNIFVLHRVQAEDDLLIEFVKKKSYPPKYSVNVSLCDQNFVETETRGTSAFLQKAENKGLCLRITL